MARSSSSQSGGFLFNAGIFAVLAGAAFWLFSHFSGKKDGATAPADEQEPSLEQPRRPTDPQLPSSACKVPENVLPASSTGAVVRHTWFALSYAEDHEQAEWVAYEITRQRLNDNWATRGNVFRPDPEVRTESATARDYASSGYDKGHLCPASDMGFDSVAMQETFLMSNISPQIPAFNMGVWRELEELARDWGRKYGRLYVVTGPVLTNGPFAQLGFNKVSVPTAFYKVLLAPETGRAIGFVLPNAVSEQPIMDYACSVDKVEQVTGVDFFPSLLNGPRAATEADFDLADWPVSSRRYQERVQKWNLKR